MSLTGLLARATALAADASRMQPDGYQTVIESREFFAAAEHGGITRVVMKKHVHVQGNCPVA